jgi:monovalent cation/hydrogen antiporter
VNGYLGLELVVALGLAVLAGDLAAPRLGLPTPVLQLLGGVVLGFVPTLRSVHLPPQAVLLIFLPVLLYWESLTTSLREIRRNLRGIVLLSTVLVVVTALGVAWTAHALGLPWGAAWVLGAALAPTDATAVGVLAHSLPRRNVTILRAESLVNDGTALVIYTLAVAAVVHTTHPSILHVAGSFATSYAVGVACGAVIAIVGWQLRKRIHETLQDNLVILLLPFASYLAAQLAHASGVLAVVTCGLIMSQIGPRVGRPATRQQTTAFWGLTTHLLNASLFVFVGLELQVAVRGLNGSALLRGVAAIAAISFALFVIRLVWLFLTIYVIRLLDRRPSQRTRRTTARARVLQSFAGFRGAVSLAAALAIPRTIATGSAFPSRNLIVFVTAGVIAVTLAQGALLPIVVRWAHLPSDTDPKSEERLAETQAITAALDALPLLAAENGIGQDIVEEIRIEYERYRRILDVDQDMPTQADDRSFLRTSSAASCVGQSWPKSERPSSSSETKG